MNRSALRLALLALAGTVVLVSGCGASAGPEAIDDPRSSTSTTSAPTGTGGDDGAEVVWQEATGGGFVPIEYALGEVPDVTIYADGTILVADRTTDGTTALVTLREAQIAPEELAAFLADAADSGLIAPGTDFGDPSVTDMPSTTVTLLTGDDPSTVSVYALDFGVDGTRTDLTPQQVGRRKELLALIDRARELGRGGAPYVPERVRATFVTGPPIDAGAKPAEWPGPPVDAFPEPDTDGTGLACLVIDGTDAEALATAAAANPGSVWNLEGEVVRIVVAPLVPGQEGCPPS